MNTARESLRELLADRLGERYRIVEEIGIGGMAIVYLAENLDFGRLVALKVLRPDKLLDSDIAVRFRSEAIAIAQLRHPNIIGIHARGEEDGLMWFEMDYVEGGSLERALDAGPLDVARVARLVAQAADGLAYAHHEGVIHRDIKPSNLLLSPSGEHLTITDFGIAKILGRTTLTETGKTLGTVAYMSPEQLMAEKALTGATDQYSLGVVAFEALTGMRPFSGDTSGQVTFAKLSIPAPLVASVLPDCPPDFDALISRMLAPDPAMRWDDLRDVRQIAEEIAVSGASRHLHGLPPAQSRRRPGKARRALGGFAIVSLVVTSIVLVRWRHPEPAVPTPVSVTSSTIRAVPPPPGASRVDPPLPAPRTIEPRQRIPDPAVSRAARSVRAEGNGTPAVQPEASAVDTGLPEATNLAPVTATATLRITSALDAQFVNINGEITPRRLSRVPLVITLPAGRVRLRISSNQPGCTERLDSLELLPGDDKRLQRSAWCPDS